MASLELIKTVQSYDAYIEQHGIEEKAVDAYYEACKAAYLIEHDSIYGEVISTKAKQILEQYVRQVTGGTLFLLEEWAEANKQEVKQINQYYDILRLEAPYNVDSFKLYIEKDRKMRDRFYQPRRNTLIRISKAIQRLENDDLDVLFLHMPPRTGKLLADDTPVFTSAGWKNHGDLVVGDKVIGSDGKFTEVIKVHPKNVANMKVTMSNGEVFYCHENHEWTVEDLFDGIWHTYETKYMFNEPKRYYLPKIEGNTDVVYIASIEKCEEKKGNCITVSNKDGLYAVGKTMQLTHNSGDITMDTLWHCSRDMEKSNLYVTYKEGLGGAFLDGVKEILQDGTTYRFADVFPDVRIVATDAKNNKIDLGRVKKYKTLSGKGLESGLNGEYDATGWLVIDDPLEGVQDVLSKEVLKRKQTIFDNNVLSRKKEKCKLILLGTLWSVNDLYGNYLEYLDSHDTGLRWDIIKIPALNEKDESNFEYLYGVGYSTQYFLNTRAKFEMNNDIAGWNAQYQQEPIERDGTVFNEEDTNYYYELPEGKPIKIIAHCDTALGGEDFLAFPIAYYYEDDKGNLRGYIEDVIFDNSEKHITQPQVVSMIKHHKIRNVHFESNQGGEGYKDDVQREIKADKTYKEPCNISSSWAPSTKSKEQRIWDNAQDIRQLYFKHPSLQSKQYRAFMRNLFSYTMVHSKRKHDDAPDALSGLVEFERNGSGATKTKIISHLI